MKSWHFSEQAYTPYTDFEGPIRLTVPSEIVDPKMVLQIKDWRLEEWCQSDELGLNIMINEHHATTNTLSTSVLQDLAVVARATKKARLLSLGVLVTNRMDPLRVAEEAAMIDILSRGRLELGLVRGANWEPFSSNINPVRARERYEEFFNLVVKTLSTTDGPFPWEGEFFQYRSVNCIPRPWQRKVPMWIPGHSTDSARWAARNDITFATFLCGYLAKILFDAYRDEYRKVHAREAPDEKLAYLSCLTVAGSEQEAENRAQIMRPYLASIGRIQQWASNPPGYQSPAFYAKALKKSRRGNIAGPLIPTKDGGGIDIATCSLEDLRNTGMLIWGTPDTVLEKLKEFREGVGGFGHLLFMPDCHRITHDEIMDSVKLYANEVVPRFEDFQPVERRQKISA